MSTAARCRPGSTAHGPLKRGTPSTSGRGQGDGGMITHRRWDARFVMFDESELLSPLKLRQGRRNHSSYWKGGQ